MTTSIEAPVVADGPQFQAPVKPGWNSWAVWSLAFAFFCWPGSVLLGVIARSDIKATGQRGLWLANTALVLSVLQGLFMLVMVLAHLR